jgi:Cys-rich protein (TIGR04453 family)
MARVSALGIWAAAGMIGAVVASCDGGSDCEEACRRVARCRNEAREGSEQVPGERAQPPDAACMARCRDKRDAWDRCEGSRKDCAGLRGCLGDLR